MRSNFGNYSARFARKKMGRSNYDAVVDPPFPPENPPPEALHSMAEAGGQLDTPNDYNSVMSIRGVVASAHFLRHKTASAMKQLGPPPPS